MKSNNSKTFQHRMRVMAIMAGVIAVCLSTSPASALPIDHRLTVNVIQVCNTDGTNCASKGPVGNPYFEDEVDKIWAQADIDVAFVLGAQLTSTLFSTIDDTLGSGHTFEDLSGGPSEDIVTMWLVHTISGPYGIAYGEAWWPGGGLAIAMDTVMAFNYGNGRLDTIAHELGHNLGLVPDSLDPDTSPAYYIEDGHDNSNRKFLMASGGGINYRLTPTTIDDIAPDGGDYDLLSDAQIAYARQSDLLDPIPEPCTSALFAIGLPALIMIRRRFSMS